MKKKDVLDLLWVLHACSQAKIWFEEQEGTVEEIYNDCGSDGNEKQADWLIWLYPYLRIDCPARTLYRQTEEGALKVYDDMTDTPYAQWDAGEITEAEYEVIDDEAEKAYDAIEEPALKLMYQTYKLPWPVVKEALEKAIGEMNS